MAGESLQSCHLVSGLKCMVKKIEDDKIKRIKELADSGLTAKVISERLGVSVDIVKAVRGGWHRSSKKGVQHHG